MQIIYNNEIGFTNPKITKKTAVALGNFDGFHIGHMILVDKIKEYAEINPQNRASCVWTFSEHSANILYSGHPVLYITANDEKIEILNKKNIDCVIFQDFNFVRYLNPEEFIDNARSIFANSFIGKDRKTRTINFKDE